jgi:hypothetical protein
MLCGRFLEWLPSTNRLQFDLLQKNSRGASPPDSKGFTSGFLRLKLCASVCRARAARAWHGSRRNERDTVSGGDCAAAGAFDSCVSLICNESQAKNKLQLHQVEV